MAMTDDDYRSQQLNHVRFRCRCGCCSNEFVIEAKEYRCCTEVPKCIDCLDACE